MADKYYAWSRILAGNKTINPGDVVTKSDIGDDFDLLVDGGSIRTVPYPEIKSTDSPREHYLREARRQLEAAQSGDFAALGESTDVKAPTGAKELKSGNGESTS
jgi:hypothetical protein